ncbi:glycosyltransferase [Alcanivorax marinus]|uniref:Glycosyltransferase n=1 Tax=Alloalcanivorax marinus TaxID=1177169 RepID=A0A9Q3YQ84_9GAMM|nr:glycosyltransferase [Alloalcanivorax marinus]MCC4309525.1 glycosyltransferase [Alloalcanivorax marinus]
MSCQTVSIALATYNGALNLPDQLQSYVGQTRLPDEVVICDDGSSDDTRAILTEFSKTAPFPVRIFYNDNNLGYTRNFEKALGKCSGDIIFLSDQDDIWYPEKIDIIKKTFDERRDDLLIIHDGDLVGQDINCQVTKRGQIISGYGSDDTFITGALTALRKELLLYAMPFPDGIVGHDGWLHSVAGLLQRRSVLKCSLQRINRHESNTSAWVASSTVPINKADVFKSQVSQKAATSYQDRLLYNAALSERINFIASRFEDAISKDDYFFIRSMLEKERVAILERERLVNSGFFLRRCRAIKMLMLGFYSHFNGIKSFARDMLR